MNHDIRIRVEGAMLERLIQRAAEHGAEFAAVRRTGSCTMHIDADERSAAILTGLCDQYRLNYKILRQGGISAFLHRVRQRRTLALGILLCGTLCAWTLSHIWIIDIVPAEGSIHADNIRAYLEEAGIRTGMAAGGIDTALLQKQLTAAAGGYSYIGVRRQGIRLLIEAAQEVPAPEIYEIDRPRDLVAAYDGIVSSVNVHSGEACVEVGDTVRAGQILIRGEEEKTKEETRPVGALGEVYVRSWFEGSAEGSLRQSVRRRTGKHSTASVLKLLNYSLPLTEGASFPSYETETEILPVGGLFLPLEIVRSHYFETESAVENIDRSILQKRLSALACADARVRLMRAGPADYEITDYWEECTTEGNLLRVRAVFEITSNIAVSRDALIEEAYTTWKTTGK